VDFDNYCTSNNTLDSDIADFVSTCSSSASLCDVVETKSESLTTATRKNKRVSFAKIEIRNYKVILGDHSYPEDGFPLSLAWEYNPFTITLNVDQYEGLRQHLRGRPTLAASVLDRRTRVPKLSYQERKNRLKIINGYSESFLMNLEEARLKEELEQQEVLPCRVEEGDEDIDGDSKTFQRLHVCRSFRNLQEIDECSNNQS
jgi:hypothetical protein